ncbi:HAMP domain-containing histidine kinase [Sporosarcina sp. Sa2YVA2]|uniref:histidine kinase n=1 Tax=Sporosarcina quadrami TaxID=2762234 RepID=A0ABR8UB72_9BACL|nr:HAMP domain-containing sensor histidine kinase [Sporosarcina quadrami]MBD7985293.1 HAMP domain-containing histidine kinase [Sporosarcina quadrami]
MQWTIRKKFLFGFFLLFSITSILVYQVMKASLEDNSTTMIRSELTKLQHTTREHVKQFALLHPPNDDLLKEYDFAIAQELRKLHKQGVALYDLEGRLLYETVPLEQPLLVKYGMNTTTNEEEISPELVQALKGKSSYTRVDYTEGTLIYFAYPLYIQDQLYGVLKFTGDYTELFAHNEKVLHNLAIWSLVLFAGVFLISFLLTSQMIRPLLQLTKATKQIAAGDYEIDVNVKTGDEIEELTKSFNEMQKKIKEHISLIEMEKEKVVQLEKSRTSFFNNVTHELKTPLAVISGYSQIIGEKDFEDTEFLRKAANKIRLESDRLNAMVIELIELSKDQASTVLKEMGPVDLLSLVTLTCEDMNIKACKRQMEFEIVGHGFFTHGNKDELRQVFINVLDNAIKYGDEQETILIAIKKSTITVCNKCAPVPASIIANAFEPFIHTSGKGSSGLGLYICKQIITRHNGTISFHYENGLANLSIKLPLWQQNGNNC